MPSGIYSRERKSTKENPNIYIMNTGTDLRQRCSWRENGKSIQMFYSRWLWEKSNGSIPKGFFLHHKDGNCLNDSIDNLELITNGEHTALHHAYIDNELLEWCMFLRKHNAYDNYKGKRREKVINQQNKSFLGIQSLRTIRKDKDLTLKQLASMAGLSVATIISLERKNYTNLKESTAIKLAKALKLSEDYFIN
jgi:DNA-binding XRE family transcriptional regulator